jgi:hypothetical protein
LRLPDGAVVVYGEDGVIAVLFAMDGDAPVIAVPPHCCAAEQHPETGRDRRGVTPENMQSDMVVDPKIAGKARDGADIVEKFSDVYAGRNRCVSDGPVCVPYQM